MRCIDYMVGSLAFSTLCREVLPRHLPVMSLSAGPMQPLPPHETAVKCLRTFLRFFNEDFRFFQDHEITTVFQEYIGGASCPSQAAYAAINMVCACSTWIANGAQPEISERFVQNAMRVLPGTLMEEPNRIAVGTLLLMVTYLIATSRSSTAAMVLGSAAQMMLLSGYHERMSSVSSQSVDDVQEVRLLYRGYVLEQDLSLRLGKPPLLTESLITSLPDKIPVDSHGVIMLPEGTSINHLREQVVLAKTQNKVYEKLRAPQCSARNGLEYLQDTRDLLDELRQWSEALPPSVRPPNVPDGLATRPVMHIKTLHYAYYQTTIAIHSAMFAFSPLFAEPAVRARRNTAVQGCAAAAREMLGLPKHLDTSHPFMPYLLHRVGWNIDGLLLNICVNRRTPEARQDLELLEGVVSAFERGAPQDDGKVAHNAVTIIYKTALEALTYPNAGNPPPI
ncbi:fungal specific transcription factor [Colletotrichum sojae]|uniref:Fungal specific transcription factor n=1 Tax=Colletotrichum sojae TaxID=2175907 RepID=A0A8H6ML15_9PEZI|nr:fungal specific transcription factor [Colletotrichum sojae]